jgi:membrane protein
MAATATRPKRQELKAFVKRLVECFEEHNLVGHAHAIAWKVLFALVPLTLAGIAVLGFLGMESVWEEEIAPQVQEAVSEDLFPIIDDTVSDVLGDKRGTWLTLGVAIALWALSGAVRAAMNLLNAIHHLPEERSFVRRYGVSFALAAAIGPLLMLSVMGIAFGDELLGALDLGPALGVALFIVRWGLGIGFLLASIWLILHFGPVRNRASRWVTFGSGLIIAVWVVTSLGYGAYITSIANYETVYGGLATIIVLLTYLNLLALAYVAGAQVDALVDDRLTPDE